ncbi:MAG TPA: 50S ribosomal protein L9 [Drouetiella sp.]
MKIILQQNVLKLGKAGDIVEASDGYFRNYLQPRKLAVVATAGTLKKREEDLETLKKKAAVAHQATVDLAEKIKALETINMFVKAGEGGKLYGKITNKEIAAELEKLVGVEIDKRVVRPTEEINACGVYRVIVKLASDVQAECTVDVMKEGTDPNAKKEKAAAAAEAAESEAAESEEEPAAV